MSNTIDRNSSVVKQDMLAIFDLPDEERRETTQKYIKLLEAEIGFIKNYVVPKEANPNIHVSIYAESKTGDPVGRVVINYLTTAHPTIDVRVLPEKQHQGYGYEMLSAVIHASFEQYAIDHLEYDVLCGNIPSRKLIQKLNGKQIYGDDVGEMYELYP